MDKRVASYTAADAVPYKIFKMPDLMAALAAGNIAPYHVQLIPTNLCNMNCGFCSCRERDKGASLSEEEINSIMGTFWNMGARAVTITGGGEPLLHPQINDVIRRLVMTGYRAGLVTNGSALHMLDDWALRHLTWLRISCSDEVSADDLLPCIENTVKRASGSGCDLAFSYVLTATPRDENLVSYIEFANKHGFSHIRVVSDLCNLENVPGMDSHFAGIRPLIGDDSRVIFQGRKNYTRGAARCLISLLKPVIGADGRIFPCCGAQYAEQTPALDLADGMAMGRAEDIRRIWTEQKPFDGSRCVRCYYSAYNDALEAMTEPIRHGEFV